MLTKFKWLSMALKNATRNRRRSLVTLAIAATGTAAALLGGGFALYTYQSLAQASARDTGHLVVAAPRFFDGVENMPLEHGLPEPEALARELLARADVKRVLPRLQFSGLISNGDKSEIFLGTGVDATQEFVVKGPFMKREAGELLDGQPGKGPGVVIGKGLAKILSAGPGSMLTLMTTTTNGSLNALDVTVKGVVSTGIADIDKRLAMVDLATAQSLLLTTKVSSLSVYLRDIDSTDGAAAALRVAHGDRLDIRTWLDQAVFYKSVKGLYDRIFGFLGVIVLVIVLFSVTNTLAMAVLERTREIGTLRAMGATPGEVMRVFTLEGLALGSGGAIAGMLLAGGVALFLMVSGFQMPPPPGRTDGYPLVVAVSAPMYAGAVVVVALLSGAASWFISRRAAHQSVVEALGHV
ncbi:ABC transporter permease [Pseudoduganella namucuonensis]|uniref:Putative ABC transport system permease protein n=1 Tax=Pseudoduganella namucuonensis TaxID=1035707 RepID=A0A1I7LBS8_9BURK|nr:FtsX-like permease family protein [Pseudoduganella namucuonensis]SFV07155.1 putative ABC transport system permease protein [Pseudoduganella namucuonensis]